MHAFLHTKSVTASSSADHLTESLLAATADFKSSDVAEFKPGHDESSMFYFTGGEVIFVLLRGHTFVRRTLSPYDAC
jgi:hypothetical protein